MRHGGVRVQPRFGLAKVAAESFIQLAKHVFLVECAPAGVCLSPVLGAQPGLFCCMLRDLHAAAPVRGMLIFRAISWGPCELLQGEVLYMHEQARASAAWGLYLCISRPLQLAAMHAIQALPCLCTILLWCVTVAVIQSQMSWT